MRINLHTEIEDVEMARAYQYRPYPERALHKIMVAKETTATCHVCGNGQCTPLSERAYACDICGSVTDRDINVSTNILHKATTAGQTGSNAWGR